MMIYDIYYEVYSNGPRPGYDAQLLLGSLQDRCQLCDYSITHFCCRSLTTNVFRPYTTFKGILNGSINSFRYRWQAERILQHHADR